MEYKSLDSLVKFVGGYSFKSEKYVPSGLRVIRITNVQDGILEDNAPCYYPIEYKDMIGNALLKEGDLLMSLTGNVGRVAFITDEFLPAGLNQRVECFRTDDNIIKKYLFYMFKSKTFIQEALKNATGAAQLNMSTTWLKDYMVPIRNSNEMNSITKTLESIESAILSEKNAILSYDSLIKSRFNELFGDPLLNEYDFEIKELSKLAPFNSVKNAIVVNNNTWLLNLDMIESDTGRIIEKIRTSEIGDSTIEFDTTCVLYSKLRPYLNKVVIPDENGIGTSELISMRCDSKIITREYLAYSLRHKSFVNYINSKTGGAKMPRTNMNDLRSFKMPIPPMELQEGFSSFVNQIDKLKFINKR